MNSPRISLAQPKLDGNERAYVLDCIDSNWISSIGKYITAFEGRFADFCGVGHAVATNNGTTALHLALVAMGLKPGEEVLVPTLTYIATANAVAYCGGVPVLVDVEPTTLALDPDLLEAHLSSRTRGILPVHLYGHPADMRRIREFADRHGLWVVEDAAEAHGAEVDGERVGGLSSCSTFSFFGNKIVTTGEGGMVTTNDAELAASLRLFRGQGMDVNRRYWFDVVGYNYRMTNIQAALGLAQMETIDTAISDRDAIAGWYQHALEPLSSEVETLSEQSWARRVFWMYNVFLASGDADRRNAVMRRMDERGIETRPIFYPMHVLPPYATTEPFPVADSFSQRGITLPMHQGLRPQDIERIVGELADAVHATS